MQNRALGAGLIFLLGSQLIYYGMKLNGSARLDGPVWSLVSGLNSLIVYSLLAIGICAFVLFVIVPVVFLFIPDKKPNEPNPTAALPLPPIVLTPEQIEKQRFRHEQMQKEAQELMEREKKRIEEKQKLEEQKKQEAIQRRRERSAEAVARDALDDFL